MRQATTRVVAALGLTATFVYSEGEWRDEPVGAAYLVVDVHDSDVATVAFESARGRGLFYLGIQPRDYWDDPAASAPVDRGRAAAALSAWASEVLGRDVAADAVEPLLAGEGDEPLEDCVEDTVMRLLDLMGIAAPTDLLG